MPFRPFARLLSLSIVCLTAFSAPQGAERPRSVAALVVAEASRGVLPTGTFRPRVLETFLRMRIVAAVLDTQAIEGPVPGPTGGLVPASWLRQQLPQQRRAHLTSVRDAWGRPLLYWSDGTNYLVLSLGSGGSPQFDYTADPPYASIARAWAGSDPTNDLLIVNGAAYRGPMSQVELFRRAMADMRSMGTACEAFAVDNNVYPGPVQPIDIVERVEHDLEPIYIRVLPKLDPWGNPFHFWSDTQSYALVSYGPDGEADFPYSTWGRAEFEALHTGPTTRVEQDLVFVAGQFVQWPAVILP